MLFCSSFTRLKRKVQQRSVLPVGIGAGTQHALRGHMGRSRQGVDRERGALGKRKEKNILQYSTLGFLG